MRHTDWNDPLARAGAYIMTIIVIGLIGMSALDRWPQAPRAQASGPVLAATPRLVQVIATPTAVPTEAPEPTATPMPEPTQAPVVEVRYEVVYVPQAAPATVPPPATVVQYQHVSVPNGAVQVSISEAGGQPTVSSIHIEGVELPRPERFTGQPVRRPDAPEAAGP